ncbi:MAG: hypothetical protein HXX17_11045 [Geobacteraceae bacterium]|nr:hypothetical protein [Geobacteraceae bacterium]
MKNLLRSGHNGIDSTVLLSFAILVAGFTFTRIADYDFWWHLNLGRSVISSLSTSPVDTFSYTFNGVKQFSSEWLTDSIMYLFFSAGGYLGVNILKFILILATFATLIKTHQLIDRSENNGWFYPSIVAVVITLFALRFRLFIRPYLFSFLFIAAFFYLLSRHEKDDDRKALLFLPLIELFWANLSKGAFYGPFIISCYLFWQIFQKKSSAKSVAVILAATIAASLANPETYRIYTLILDFASKGKDVTMVGEQQPLSSQILWGQGLGYTFGYQLLVVGSLIYFTLLKGWKNLFHLLLFITFFIPSLLMVRMIDFFSIIGCIFTFKTVQAAMGPISGRLASRKKLAAAIFSLGMIIILIITVPGNRTYSFGLGVKEEKTPEGALSFLDREGVKGRIFNSYAFGGYIPWRSPQRQVFIDGRINQLFPTSFHKEYFRIIAEPAQWKKAEETWGFDTAILEYDLKSQNLHFPAHLAGNPEWALVYWDNHSIVYLKRTPQRKTLIDRLEYRAARPTFIDLSYLDESVKAGKLNESLMALDREVAMNPDNQYVLLARVYLRYQLGKLYLPQIREDLEKVLPMKPDFAMKHSALAMILNAAGEKELAKKELKEALRLNPLDEGAIVLAKELGIKVNIPKGALPGHP